MDFSSRLHIVSTADHRLFLESLTPMVLHAPSDGYRHQVTGAKINLVRYVRSDPCYRATWNVTARYIVSKLLAAR